MRTKRTFLAAAAVAVTATLALSACGGGSDQDGASGDGTAPLLRIGSLEEPKSFDPAQANEGHPAPIYQAVYDTLIKREANGDLSPMLATSWKASEDGLAFTLELRDDVTFTDGAEFNGDVVKTNIDHFKTANGPLGSSLAAVDSVEVEDADTVVLRLSEPDPGLPYSLTNAAGYMASPDAVGTESITTAPVGSGPYTLDTANTVVGSKIAFERNDDYWGEVLPYDKVEFHVLTDETARLNALKSGQIDAAHFLRASSAADADAAGFLHEPYATNWEGIFFFDRTGAQIPELADVRVREALALAIDREALLDVVALGRGELTSQTFAVHTDGYNEEFDSAYEYNPARAEQLLADAGAENLSITLPVSPAFDPTIYESIMQNWRDVGVTVERHDWGPGEAIPSMTRGERHVAYMSLVQRADWQHVQLLVAPDATWNPLGTSDPELQGYIDALQNGDTEAATQINEFLVENFWFSPLYRLEQFQYHSDKVEMQNQAEQAVPSIYNYAPAGE